MTDSQHRTLLLLRHAKSDYPAGVADHDRPLAPRGIREAGLAGDWLRANAPDVDAVLCSTATRTRQTLARTGIDAPVSYVDRLYDVDARRRDRGDQRRASLADDVGDTLLVIGHEPAMSAVALGLADRRRQQSALRLEEISTKFPTSAIAVLRTAEPWDRAGAGRRRAVDFHVPR